MLFGIDEFGVIGVVVFAATLRPGPLLMREKLRAAAMRAARNRAALSMSLRLPRHPLPRRSLRSAMNRSRNGIVRSVEPPTRTAQKAGKRFKAVA